MTNNLLFLVVMCLVLGINGQNRQKQTQVISSIELMDLTEILKELNLTISQLLQQEKSLNQTANGNKVSNNAISTSKTSQKGQSNNKIIDNLQLKNTPTFTAIKNQQKVVDKPKEEIKIINNNDNKMSTKSQSNSLSIADRKPVPNNDIAKVQNINPIPSPTTNKSQKTLTETKQSPSLTINVQISPKNSPSATSNKPIPQINPYANRTVAGGPGPLDKNLPPVIDNTNLIVHYSAKTTPSNTASTTPPLINKVQVKQNNNEVKAPPSRSRAVDPTETKQSPSSTINVQISPKNSPSATSNKPIPQINPYANRTVAGGPGPLDKNLPPVIDNTNLIVHYSAKTTPSNTASTTPPLINKVQVKQNNEIKVPIKPPSRARGVDPIQTTNQNQQKKQTIVSIKTKSIPQPIIDKTNINILPQKKIEPKILSPKIQQIQTPTQIPTTPTSINNIIIISNNKKEKEQIADINKVQLNPIIFKKQQLSSQSSLIKHQQINVKKHTPAQAIIQINQDSSIPKESNKFDHPANQLIFPYQYVQRTVDALYPSLPSYLDLQRYFIITNNDSRLPKLQDYLMKNYGHYLNQGKLIAGFRRYIIGGDRSIQYQLFYKTIFGTFTTIITYYLNQEHLQLKTLSLLNFDIMDIDFANCLVKNEKEKSCEICKSGYRNFMGRCRQFDKFCKKYITDECIQCLPGKRTLYGQCL